MKRIGLSFLVLVAIVLSAVLTSCDKIDELGGVYTVTFDSKGGSKVESQKVNEGELVTKPSDPTRDGHSFDGWAKADNESSAFWNFKTETVTASMTLYARWSANTYKITFDSNGGSSVSAQNVLYGATVTKPTDPTRNGYEFDGWFNGDKEWNFSTTVSSSVTLKAKWIQVHVVTFNADNGSDIITQTIRSGTAVGKPADPIKVFSPAALLFAGSINLNTLPSHDTFVEWRKEGESTAFNFTTPITASITLKAVWNSPSVQGTVDISTQTGSNRAEQAFTYVKTNPAEYTLLLGEDVTIGRKSLDVSHLRLTIIGLGTQRTISFSSSTNPSITIGAQQRVNISLTLGNNIKLDDGSVQVTREAEFVMLDGSDISGYISGYPSTAAVTVLNGATFTMKGGEIKNNSRASVSDFSNGVSVDGGTFNMEGGKIRNNTGDVYVSQSSSFSLSGSAEVGFVYLNASSTENAAIAISTGWSGMVDKLNFTGSSSMTNVINSWVGKQTLTGTGVNSATIAKISLGNFVYSNTTQSLANYEINSNGVLASKQ